MLMNIGWFKLASSLPFRMYSFLFGLDILIFYRLDRTYILGLACSLDSLLTFLSRFMRLYFRMLILPRISSRLCLNYLEMLGGVVDLKLSRFSSSLRVSDSFIIHSELVFDFFSYLSFSGDLSSIFSFPLTCSSCLYLAHCAC